MSSRKDPIFAFEVPCGRPVEKFIQTKVTYLFWNMQHPLPFLLRQEEGGHLREEESITKALLTKGARGAVIGIHHLVFMMTNEQIATSTFH